MKTTEQLAIESGAAQLFGLPSDWESGDYVISPAELETFRRLVIEDFVAGLEPVARLLHWKGPKYPQVPFGGVCARTFAEFPSENADHPDSYWKNGTKLYSLEGVKK